MMLVILCFILLNHLASTFVIISNSSTPEVGTDDNANKSESFDIVHKLGNNVKSEEGDTIAKRSNDPKPRMLFTDFLVSALTVLSTFSDPALQSYLKVLDAEVRKYHYKGCKFHELLQVEGFRELLRGCLEDVSNTPVSNIKERIKTAQSMLKENKIKVEERDILEHINTLYHEEDTEKFNKSLTDIEKYKDKQDPVELKKIVKAGLRSVIFDHYSKLHVNVRKDLLMHVSGFLSSISKGKNVVSRHMQVNADNNDLKENDNKTTTKDNKVSTQHTTTTVKYMPSVPEGSSSESETDDYESSTKKKKNNKDAITSTKESDDDRSKEKEPPKPTTKKVEKNVNGDIKDWVEKINHYILSPKDPLKRLHGRRNSSANGTDAGDTEEDIELHKKAGPKQGYNIKVVRKNKSLFEVLNVNYELIDVINGTNTSSLRENQEGAQKGDSAFKRFDFSSVNHNGILNPLPDNKMQNLFREDKVKNSTKNNETNKSSPKTPNLVNNETNIEKNDKPKHKTVDEFSSTTKDYYNDVSSTTTTSSTTSRVKKTKKKKKHARKHDTTPDESKNVKELLKSNENSEEKSKEKAQPFTSPIISEEFMVNRKMNREDRSLSSETTGFFLPDHTVNIANEIKRLEKELELLKSRVTTEAVRKAVTTEAVRKAVTTEAVPKAISQFKGKSFNYVTKLVPRIYRILETKHPNARLAQLSRPRSPLMAPSIVFQGIKSNKSRKSFNSSITTTSSTSSNSPIARQYTRSSNPYHNVKKFNSVKVNKDEARDSKLIRLTHQNNHSNSKLSNIHPEIKATEHTTVAPKLFEVIPVDDGHNKSHYEVHQLSSNLSLKYFSTMATNYERVTNDFFKAFKDIKPTRLRVEFDERKVINDMLDELKSDNNKTAKHINNIATREYANTQFNPFEITYYNFDRKNDFKHFMEKIMPENYNSTLYKTKITQVPYQTSKVTPRKLSRNYFDRKIAENNNARRSLKYVLDKLKSYHASSNSSDPGIISYDTSVEAFTDINHRFPKYNDVLKKSRESKREIASLKSATASNMNDRRYELSWV